ncbi:MAG TPA: type I methionyl aminopeptidase [Epulopiscium sp.]|nr:type I methionyl aminopeptidase [Candidatus Epulonipiscium sp.]
MAISIKSDAEIEKMRQAAEILVRTHELIAKHIRVGVTTRELDDIAESYIISQGAIPSFKDYGGYPATICASINDEVVHGIPSTRKLQQGDILSVDAGVYFNGYHSDSARSYGIGELSPEMQKLIDVTKQSFYEGLKFAKVGHHLSEISQAIQKYVESNGFSIVRDLVGHGIGRELHEEPQIPNYKTPGRGPKLRKGMVLAIEPMVNIGTWEVNVLSDDWTVVTRDGMPSAHYENTIVITDDEPEILTIPKEDTEVN